jgi:hypothetical protein
LDVLFVQTRQFIFTSSWAALHRRLVGIDISGLECHRLALPFLFWFPLH